MDKTTAYFWVATLSWPTSRGPAIRSASNIYETAEDDPVMRSEVLGWVRDYAAKQGVPRSANVMFFTVERNEVA